MMVGCLSSSGPGIGGGDGTTTSSSGAIRIDGSSTVYPISALVTEIYNEQKPGARITVAFSGTGGGMKKFIAGEIDICDASRAIKESERESCAAAGVEFIELEVAYDGLAVVLSPENDWCDCMTVEQLKELWEPESAIKKWSDLDRSWPDEEIVLYGPGTDSGTFDYFTEVIVGESKASRSDYNPSEDDNVLVTGVGGDKYALGYFGFAYFEENKSKLKLMGVDGGDGCMTPSLETVSQNTYKPLSRPLYIYVRKSSLQNASVADFVSYYLDHAAEAAAEVGYVPVKQEAHQANLQKLSEATQQ